MLIHDENGYHFQCDACGKLSASYPTQVELDAWTNLGSSLYSSNPGWVHPRGQLQITGDEALLWNNQFQIRRGVFDSSKHICPSCRGLFNLY